MGMSPVARRLRKTQRQLEHAMENLRKVEDKKAQALKKLVSGSQNSSRIYVLTSLLGERILAISTNSKPVMMKGIRLVMNDGKSCLFHVYAGRSGRLLNTLIMAPPDTFKLLISETEKAAESLSKKT